MTAADRWAARHGLSRWEMGEVLRDVEPVARRGVVLEIGVFEGDSLGVWREFLDPCQLIGIDPDPKTTPENDELIGSATILCARSQEPETLTRVLELLDGSKLDFLYIDGDHTYDAVVSDWGVYHQLVRPGGVIALHDAVITDNPTVEVHKFYEQIRRHFRTKLLYDPLAPSTGCALVFV